MDVNQLIAALEEQRNNALNQAAQATAYARTLEQKLEELEKEKENVKD